VDGLNASMAQLRTELAASTAQQAQHEQDNTQQQAEFVGQVNLALLCHGRTTAVSDCDRQKKLLCSSD